MIELDIVERLRGKVRIPVNDGAGLLDGKDFFERQFPASKSAMEAADEIERLRNELAKCGKENCMGHEIEGHALWVRKERLDDALKQLVKQSWQPIETAPKDRRIRVWTWGNEHHARWEEDEYAKNPRPYWSIDALGRALSRAHQPRWWMPCADDPEISLAENGK